MKKAIILFSLFISIAVLTSCNAKKPQDKDLETNNSISPEASEVLESPENDTIPFSGVDFMSEEDVRDYLVGQWVYDFYYRGDVICIMDIDKDLNVNLSFENFYSDEPKGEYKGKISLERVHSFPSQAPDLISLSLIDTDEPGGDFYFLHRTIYDGKRVMSWFPASNGNSVFDVLDISGGFRSVAEEIIFEKVTGEVSQEEYRKSEDYYVVYWGMGPDNKSMWIDDVSWSPPHEDCYESLYPRAMNKYTTDLAESVLCNIAPDSISEVLGDDLTRGGVYFIELDENGHISYLIDAERKYFLEEDYMDYELEMLIYDIFENDLEETKEYLEMGMSILISGETEIIEDEECYYVFLGTDHEERFVREVMYAINPYTLQVYRFDVLNDRWESLTMG
ncbi:MAG TPA: hypothetical protein VFC79_01925 [Tissierellaceae bacterium]|nr:hypothetical protein [Tissierellaceae bacterium]